MQAKLTIILIFGILIICCQPVDDFKNTKINVGDKNIPIDKNQSYFPLELFPRKKVEFVKGNNATTQIT